MQQWSFSVLEGITPQRENASVVLDAASQTVYMFGGCDKAGLATDNLFSLDLSAFPKSGWQLVQCVGSKPQPRWGHSSFVAHGKLWVYGGFASHLHKSALTDLHVLDLASSTWSTAAQDGDPHDRAFASSKQKTFQAVAAVQDTMLAFGREAQDENSDPRKPAGAAELLLHAYDLPSATWRSVPTSGRITFDHLEALLAVDKTLLAVGWSLAPAGVKADCYMQVCSLDLNTSPSNNRLSGAGFSQPRLKEAGAWSLLPANGSVPIARVGCAACVLLGAQPMLVLHGGMLCSHSVQGRLTSDTFCLDLRSLTWTRLQPASDKLMNSSHMNLPRVSHSALPLPSEQALLLIGGTSTRQSHASATTMECLRHIQAGSAAAATAAAAAAAAPAVLSRPAPKAEELRQARPHVVQPQQQQAAAGGLEHGWALSSTPTMIGLATQPFAHLSTPPAAAATPAAAVTPAVHAAQTPAASAPLLARSLVPAYDFSRFCCQEALSDVELVAGGVSFPAHRLLLCSQSPQLAHYLQQAEVSPTRPLDCKWVLTLQDLFPDVLKLMLMFMYGCLQSIPVEAAPALFTASIRYGLPGLSAACLSVLVAAINFETVTSYILLAHQHKCGELTQACVVFAAATFERLQQVLNTPGFLHLNKSNPQVGAMFVQMAMQYMAARR